MKYFIFALFFVPVSTQYYYYGNPYWPPPVRENPFMSMFRGFRRFLGGFGLPFSRPIMAQPYPFGLSPFRGVPMPPVPPGAPFSPDTSFPSAPLEGGMGAFPGDRQWVSGVQSPEGIPESVRNTPTDPTTTTTTTEKPKPPVNSNVPQSNTNTNANSVNSETRSSHGALRTGVAERVTTEGIQRKNNNRREEKTLRDGDASIGSSGTSVVEKPPLLPGLVEINAPDESDNKRIV